MDMTPGDGTGILQLAQILASGVLEGSAPDDHDTSGVYGFSMTADLETALKFAGEAKERDWDGQWNSPVEDGVVIELDGNALDASVGLVRVSWDGSDAEAEYRSRGDVGDAVAAIRSVTLDAESCRWWIEAMRDDGREEAAAALERMPLSLLGAEHPEGATLSGLLADTGSGPAP
jgi:hypothetical protein